MAERPAPLVLVVDPGATPDPGIPFGSYAAVGIAGRRLRGRHLVGSEQPGRHLSGNLSANRLEALPRPRLGHPPRVPGQPLPGPCQLGGLVRELPFSRSQ